MAYSAQAGWSSSYSSMTDTIKINEKVIDSLLKTNSLLKTMLEVQPMTGGDSILFGRPRYASEKGAAKLVQQELFDKEICDQDSNSS